MADDGERFVVVGEDFTPAQWAKAKIAAARAGLTFDGWVNQVLAESVRAWMAEKPRLRLVPTEARPDND